jgi:branched-chain amino acid transport system substrate-binding protein
MSVNNWHHAGSLIAVVLVVLATAVKASAEIAIGLATPLSGPLAASGARNLLAAMTAVEHLNENGGVLGEPVRLISVDDQCGIREAITAAEELVRADVAMVVGHTCSHSSVLAAAMYDVADIIMITPDSTHPRLTEEGRPNVFRLIGRDDLQAAAAAALIAERWPDARIAIAHDESVYGEGLARRTERALRGRDIEIVVVATYDANQPAYPDLVERLAAAEIEVLYIGGYGPDAGRIVVDVRIAGIDLQLIGGDGLATDEFWAVAGEAGTGTIVSSFELQDATAETPTIAPERQHVLTEFAGGGLGAYAAVELWAQAASRAGSFGTKAVIDALQNGQFDTVRGSVVFDAKGDLQNAAWTWEIWRDGKKLPLD